MTLYFVEKQLEVRPSLGAALAKRRESRVANLDAAPFIIRTDEQSSIYQWVREYFESFPEYWDLYSNYNAMAGLPPSGVRASLQSMSPENGNFPRST